jgi:cytochrome c biogenesis factor
MFLAAYFTTGRIIFIIFFVITFISLAIYSYKKDSKNHQIHYKNAAKNLTIYGGLVLIIFVIIRLLTGH